MTTFRADEIKEAVRGHYGDRAEAVLAHAADAACCGDSPKSYAATFYDAATVAELPETVVSYGCGNPTAIAGLRAGETVLDLGSGAGLDCFISARTVGDAGRVIGLDMTDSMLELARANQAKLGLANVEFRKGEMEAMPVADGDVDVIISNCVINLSPDKDAVFRESFRVLRPGGRLHVSDVVLLRGLSEAEQNDLNAWAGCISGALHVDDYRARLEAAGFTGVEIDVQGDGEKAWQSALITAYKRDATGAIRPPAAASGRRPSLLSEIPLEVVSADGSACCAPAAVAAETGEAQACCGTDTSSCC